MWGWQSDVAPVTGNLSFLSAQRICTKGFPGTFVPVQTAFVYTDTQGTAHQFPFVIIGHDPGNCIDSPGPEQQNATLPALDHSGLTLIAHGLNNYVIEAADGKIIIPTYNLAPSTSTITDQNGNEITTVSSSTVSTIEDTTGTTVVTLAGGGTPSSPRTVT